MSGEIIGIDHIYFAVSDPARSEEFYDRAMRILGFRKNSFLIEGGEERRQRAAARYDDIG